jgi:general secretion pathway protein G
MMQVSGRYLSHGLLRALARLWGRNQRSVGLTIIELMIVLMIMSTLASFGVPLYASALDNARVTKAVADIRVLEREIQLFQGDNRRLPNTLAEVGRPNLRDPYGNPYEYLRIAGANIKGKGQFRKDRFLVPLNSDYDLYSKGKDGNSVSPLTAKQSRDDIVRANNGGYVGLASEY